MVKLTYIALIILLSPLANAGIKRSDGAVFLNTKAYSISLTENVFSTTGYYDISGNINNLPSDYAFMLADTELRFAYAYTPNIQFEGMGRFRYISSQTSVTGQEPQILTKTGIESGEILFKYLLPKVGRNHFAIGMHFRQSLYSNSKYNPPQTAPTNQVVLGDDGSEIGLNFYSSYLFDSSRIDANVSYVRPNSDLSQELQYKIQGMYQFTSLSVLTGIDGVYSLKKDPYATDPNLKPKVSLGATSLFNSINREKMNVFFGALYDTKKYSFEAKGGMVASGKYTDKGYFASFNVNIASSGENQDNVKINSFKEYIIEGSVLKLSARGSYIKIDQGLTSDVEKGMAFDIYQTDYFGGNILVATGTVFEVGSDWSVIKLSKKFNDIEIKPGFAARGK